MEEVCTMLTNSTTVAATRIPPSKPHFFHPLLPGFHQQLFIPISFFKYLGGQKCENAILRSSQGEDKWPVKINGRRLEDGWTDFAQDHDLHVGDFLVFRHEGDMVFDVIVFDPSFCEREYPPFDPKEGKESSMDESPKDFNGSKAILKNKQAMTRPKAKPTSFTSSHAYFVSTVKPHNLKECRMHIPMNFARSNGLTNRRCKMTLKDQKQRSWPVKLSHSASHVYIAGCGWRDFRIANGGLKEGDAFMFELIKKGKKPIMKFHRLEGIYEANQAITPPKAKVTPATLGHRYFFRHRKVI